MGPRNVPPVIRRFDDLTAALKSGAIKPHVRREDGAQVLDPFAETGLSLIERKKVMLRSFGHAQGDQLLQEPGRKEANQPGRPGDFPQP
jgi:hypothetical protein